jgi:hypothetical protein
MKRIGRSAIFLLLSLAGVAGTSAASVTGHDGGIVTPPGKVVSTGPVGVIAGTERRRGSSQFLGEFAPGLAAKSMLLGANLLDISNEVIGRQVMNLAVPLEDTLRRDNVYKGAVGFLLSGYFRVDRRGTHDLMVNIVQDNGGACGVSIWVDGNLLANKIDGASRARLLLSVMGEIHLQPGLYPVRFWIACRVSDYESLAIRILQRNPGETDFHFPKPYQFVHEFR